MSTPTTVHVAYDDVTLNLIPPDARTVVAYVDGIYANYEQAKARFPHAEVIGITVTGQHGAHIRFCDCETRDLSVAQTIAWLQEDIAAGYDDHGPYGNVSTMVEVLAQLDERHVPVERYVTWSAHYGIGEHICAPGTCGYPGLPRAVDGTQFTEWAQGKSLDESAVTQRWLGTLAPPKPAPAKHELRGVAHFAGTVNLQTGRWTIHGIPWPGVKLNGPDEAWVAQLNLQVGGASRGHWSIQGKPAQKGAA